LLLNGSVSLDPHTYKYAQDNSPSLLLSASPVALADQQTETAILTHYADIALAKYEDSLTTAKTLDNAIDAFLSAPAARTLADARAAWIAARAPYQQTEVYRFGNVNEAGEIEANVTTGYHAIEFLLWGQDLNGTGKGAGNRAHTDFSLSDCTNDNCDRRRDYLKAASSLLIADLEEMVGNWTTSVWDRYLTVNLLANV